VELIRSAGVRPRPSPIAFAAALAVGLACSGAVPRSAGVDLAADARAVVTELAGMAPPRSAEHPDSMARAADGIAERFRAAGLAPWIDGYEVEGATYRNVGVLIGTGKRERIVVGAHYDVYRDLPGADDNASGVAALLGVARLLADRALGADVELVAYALEEAPFYRTDDMGSVRHARALASSGVSVRAMFALEMVGYYADAPGSQEYHDPSLRERFGDRGNFLAVIGRPPERPVLHAIEPAMRAASDLPVWSLAAPPGTPAIDRSDHASFWNEGFRAVLVTDTAFLRNPHYHQASDLPATLDYERLAKAARAVAAAVVALAGETP
jgi:Zn-dependent M28 family amino/carboxypeptidase